MKEIKIIAIAVIITIAVMLSCACAMPAYAEQNRGNGDIVNLLMWNVSEHEKDNEIIEVYWEGYTEDISSFFQMNGWR